MTSAHFGAEMTGARIIKLPLFAYLYGQRASGFAAFCVLASWTSASWALNARFRSNVTAVQYVRATAATIDIAHNEAAHDKNRPIEIVPFNVKLGPCIETLLEANSDSRGVLFCSDELSAWEVLLPCAWLIIGSIFIFVYVFFSEIIVESHVLLSEEQDWLRMVFEVKSHTAAPGVSFGGFNLVDSDFV